MANREREVEGVARQRYWRAAQAQVVVEAWQRSGEELTEFASRYGVRPRRLRRWASELGAEAEAETEALHFHRVRVVQPVGTEDRGDTSLEIVLGEGCRVRVPAGFAAADLERVLEVLGARC